MVNELLSKSNSVDEFRITRKRKIEFKRLRLLFFILFINSLCLFLASYNIKVSVGVQIVIGLFYFLGTTALNFDIDDNRVTFYEEYDCRNKQKEYETSSLEIPKTIPFNDKGFIGIRLNGDKNEYYKFQINYTLTHIGKDIDFCNCQYATLSVGGYHLSKETRDYTICDFEKQFWKMIEDDGHKIVNIDNKYGDRLWTYGKPKKLNIIQKWLCIIRPIAFRITFIAIWLSPYIWILKNINITSE